MEDARDGDGGARGRGGDGEEGGGTEGWEERRSERSRGPSGPTCFDFEEVQPAKLSLRDDRDRLFVPRRISLYIPILPSFSLASNLLHLTSAYPSPIHGLPYSPRQPLSTLNSQVPSSR